ncbi:hypothetical protein [Bdellovibrio sp. HCB288]|uniref:hypothetical protein n=1 Tax=Bdellovibrio sp. HCB288 TaxID=3394355 RepID=UPI0039B623E0
MAKKQSGEVVRVFLPTRADGAYGFNEYEISADALKEGKLVKSQEPDIFAIFVNNFTRAMREFFGI